MHEKGRLGASPFLFDKISTLSYNILVQITVTQAANQLKVNPATIRSMCSEGRIPTTKISDNHHRKHGIWLVDPKDVIAYWQKLSDKFQCKHLSPPDAAYLAGLLDGEGCFTAFITQTRSHHIKNGLKTIERTHWQTIYYIQILMVEEEPIRWLKEVTGLGYLFQRNRQKEGYQDLWGWRVNSEPACQIIKQIMPYLKAKRHQAKLFLKLRDRITAMKHYRNGKSRDAPMPEAEYIERQKLIDEIHRLNKSTGKVLRKEYSVEAT